MSNCAVPSGGFARGGRDRHNPISDARPLTAWKDNGTGLPQGQSQTLTPLW